MQSLVLYQAMNFWYLRRLFDPVLKPGARYGWMVQAIHIASLKMVKVIYRALGVETQITHGGVFLVVYFPPHVRRYHLHYMLIPGLLHVRYCKGHWFHVCTVPCSCSRWLPSGRRPERRHCRGRSTFLLKKIVSSSNTYHCFTN